MRPKIFKVFWLWALVILILPVNCKKGITTPEQMPVIWINTSVLSFAASQLGPNPLSQVLIIKNTGFETLTYTISEDSDFYGNSWINISPMNGASNIGQEVEHIVTIDKSSLTPREDPYTAKITVQSSNAYNSPQLVDVSLIVSDKSPASIEISPNTLNFKGNVGGPNPEVKSFQISNGGEETLQYTVSTDASWLDVTPAEGNLLTGKRTHTVEVTIGGLGKGIHNGIISITDPNASNNPQTIAVSLELSDIPPPEIEVSPATITFDALVGNTRPPSQKIQIRNIGDGTLNYEITWDTNWLDVAPISGKSRGPTKNHTVSVNIGGMNEGTYSGRLQVSDPTATNNPQTVRITLEVTTQPPAPPPPPTPPPSTANEIWIDCSPASGGSGTVVAIQIGITGNTTAIDAFGLSLTFDPSAFRFLSYARGGLTGSFSFLEAWDTGGGVVNAGGVGGAAIIPVRSTGTLIELNLQVIGAAGSYPITISNMTDDIQGMIPSPSSVTFIVN